jgi:hypothetical protein
MPFSPCPPPPPVATDGAWYSPPCPPPPPSPPCHPLPPAASEETWTPPPHPYIFVFCPIELTITLVNPDTTDPRGGHSSQESDCRTRSKPAQTSSEGSPCTDDTAAYWDPERRELWFRGKLVKKYRQPAPHQCRILAAFQEAGWPRRIDDPLPGGSSESARKQRVADAVRLLNDNPYLLFERDGTGEGILWSVRPEAT